MDLAGNCKKRGVLNAGVK